MQLCAVIDVKITNYFILGQSLSQEEECLLKRSFHFGENGFTDDFGEFARRLETGRHLYRPGPVVVVVALLIRELRQSVLRQPGVVVGDHVVRRGAGALRNLLSSQVEVILVIDRHLIQDDASWVRVVHLGHEFALWVLASTQGVETGSDSLVNCDVHDLWSIVFLVELLPDFLAHRVQGVQLTSHLCSDLVVAEALSIDNDSLRGILNALSIVFGPVHKYLLDHSLWDRLFLLDANLAAVEHMRQLVVDRAYKPKGESLLSLGERQPPVHNPSLIKILIPLHSLPKSSADLGVHLEDHF